MPEHDLKQDIEDMESLAEILETMEASSGAKLRRVIEAARPAEEDELYELRKLFELQWDCSQRATKIWQEKTGKEGVWPDKTDLLVFLMDELEASEEKQEDIMGQAYQVIGTISLKLEDSPPELIEALDYYSDGEYDPDFKIG